MRNYILYIKKCPGITDPKNFKIGIAALDHARARLATYQNTVGPEWEEEFLYVWLGKSVNVREAEKKFKRTYKDKISSDEAGLSEWICDIELIELLNYAQELIDEHFIKLVVPPQEFLPLTMPLCEDLANWYIEYIKTSEEETKD